MIEIGTVASGAGGALLGGSFIAWLTRRYIEKIDKAIERLAKIEGKLDQHMAMEREIRDDFRRISEKTVQQEIQVQKNLKDINAVFERIRKLST